MSHEAKLAVLGFPIESVSLDNGRFLQATRSGQLIFTAGQVSTSDKRVIRGKVGGDLTIEDGREAARLCTVNCLRAIRSLIGSIDHIKHIVKVFGMVNVGPGFDETPVVIDACSEMLVDVFGDAGRHARSAVGMTIPLNYAVEIEMIVEIEPAYPFYDMPV